MEMNVGTIYHGFELLEKRHIEEINADAFVYAHHKSGARLLFLASDDDNKVFSVSFRTPPPDSTGVPHILEHSVLCGSRKYPLKEPFVELIKGSLNTYLNAMTFSDKTMYPVASKNDKDFRNLMDVYLDAVFFPNIYEQPEILMQEGWHYEIENPQDEITYKGVVYNEMKGVFSSPEAVLERKVQEVLFPDTPYGVESGGDPDAIPALTQQQFEEFHRKYYHPSNSYIFLYGDLEITERLEYLDKEYLSRFDKIAVESDIPLQPAFLEPRTHIVEYPISGQEKEEGKTFLSLNFVTGDVIDVETDLAMSILKQMLLGTPAAPLRKALLEAGIGKDVFGSYNDSMRQPTFTVAVRNADPEQADAFEATVLNTLRTLADQGIDKALVEASVNIKEFQLREANYGTRPKGLGYNIQSMASWLYDAHPTLHLEYSPVLERVKQGLTADYFERLIRKYFLENNHRALIIAKPKRGLAEQRAEEIRQELAAYKAQLSEQQIQKLITETEKLKERQTTADSSEALSKIPLLTLGDIERTVEALPLVEKEEEGIKVLAHPLFTNHIAYVNLYFNTHAVPKEYIPYVYLLSGILGKVDTTHLAYADLANQINIHTGGITYGAVAFSDVRNPDAIHPKLVVKSKCLVEKLPRLMELLGAVIGNSVFDDTRRIKELVHEIKAKSESYILELGQTVATTRMLSYCSPAAQYNEAGLLSFYRFASELEANIDTNMDQVIANIKKTAAWIFNRDGVLISVTTDEEDYDDFRRSLPVLTKQLGSQTFPKASYNFGCHPKNEGLMTSSKVQYVIKGYNFKRLGFSYTGSLKVLETILRYDYLWNRIRVQGGAYGGFAQFDRTGSVVFGSYRDPNLRETLAAYDEVVDYLRNFNVSDREMTKYIIGTMSGIDTPLTASMKGERATIYYLQGVTQTDIQTERDEILGTRQSDIKELATLVETVLKENCLCVLGSEEKIKSNSDCFGELVHVFE